MRSREARPAGGFEVTSWLFMRVSGLLLLFLALFHFFWMHFVIGVEKIDFDVVVSRWSGGHGPFWRMYDLFLLAFAFTHGMNGARQVAEDYLHSPGWRVLALTVLALIWFVLIVMGGWIIFTFQPGMPTPFR